MLTGAVGGVAVNTGINLLYLVLAIMLGFIIVSAVLLELSARGIAVSLELPRRAFWGEEFVLRGSVRNRKRLFGSYCLHLGSILWKSAGDAGSIARVMDIRPGGAVRFGYPVSLTRRGVHRVEGVKARTSYPFGLLERSFLLSAEATVIVYPAIGEILRLPPGMAGGQRWEGEAEVALPGQGFDLFGLREYRHGDNPKWIHWRSSARTGAVMLRQFERERAEAANIVFDSSGPAAEGKPRREQFELGVSYVASLVRHLAAEGRRVCLAVWPAHAEALTTDGGEGVEALLELLALVEPGPETSSAEGWRALESKLIPQAPSLLVRWRSPERGGPGSDFAGLDGGLTTVLSVQAPEFEQYFVSPTAGRGFGAL